jgi:hypothetical protein
MCVCVCKHTHTHTHAHTFTLTFENVEASSNGGSSCGAAGPHGIAWRAGTGELRRVSGKRCAAGTGGAEEGLGEILKSQFPSALYCKKSL